jgi:phosphatidate phosphatase APP1
VTDIDDTVKLTDVAHKSDAFLRALFSRKAFAGVSTLFREISAQNDEAVLYFVSGAPHVLRKPLVEMVVKNQFPRPWMLSLRELSVPTPDFKIAKIGAILDSLPQDAELLLLGDDGERDPETYAAIRAKYPDRVAGTYIHRIQGRSLPAGELAYDTPMDIALAEMENGNLSPEQAVRVGNAVLAESQNDDEKLVIRYNFCPMTFEPPSQHPLLPEGHDAYELSSRIQTRIRQICIQRKDDRPGDESA